MRHKTKQHFQSSAAPTEHCLEKKKILSRDNEVKIALVVHLFSNKTFLPLDTSRLEKCNVHFKSFFWR